MKQYKGRKGENQKRENEALKKLLDDAQKEKEEQEKFEEFMRKRMQEDNHSTHSPIIQSSPAEEVNHKENEGTPKNEPKTQSFFKRIFSRKK